jgi:imidazolonepropionase-like amidohydrolase
MSVIVFENALIFDGHNEPGEEANVVIEGDRIVEISTERTRSAGTTIDCRGRFLMPGLIDAHFHANSPDFNIFMSDHYPSSLMASHAGKVLSGTLRRGFTTVRDAGGGDIGLARAIEQGVIEGPRFFFSGKALSQTGGHGDFRPGDQIDPCGCNSYSGHTSRVVDGVDEVRKAAREELRKGATQIKLFVSGGVLSPTDPMWMPQFSDAEIRAAVEEAATRRTYVMAHAHTDDASRRCAQLGVRTIEHGTLIDSDETAAIIAEAGAFVVPTLVVVDVLMKHAGTLGIPAGGYEKLKGNAEQMLASIELCQKAGVRLGLGTDLYDHRFHPHQGDEFRLRGQVSKAIDVMRSATSVNAEIVQRSGQLGCIAPGALADILVLDANPLDDLGLLADPRNMTVIMKGGRLIEQRIDAAG